VRGDDDGPAGKVGDAVGAVGDLGADKGVAGSADLAGEGVPEPGRRFAFEQRRTRRGFDGVPVGLGDVEDVGDAEAPQHPAGTPPLGNLAAVKDEAIRRWGTLDLLCLIVIIENDAAASADRGERQWAGQPLCWPTGRSRRPEAVSAGGIPAPAGAHRVAPAAFAPRVTASGVVGLSRFWMRSPHQNGNRVPARSGESIKVSAAPRSG
jgi:hypothetical protein